MKEGDEKDTRAQIQISVDQCNLRNINCAHECQEIGYRVPEE